MLDFLKGLIMSLPQFALDLYTKLTLGSMNERLEYIVAAVLLVIMAAFLFVPGTVLKLRRKIIAALLFTACPIILLFTFPVPSAAPDTRMAVTWPHFALVAVIFTVIYILEELVIWRPFSRKRRHYYPTWLKPPGRYSK